jgi:Kef-type K+ transport system membrane component KefB
MATSFQPEKPHAPARGGRSGLTAVAVAVVTALLAMMLVALAVPSQEEGANWLWTLGAGALVFIAVLAYGLSRGSGNRDVAE